MQYTGQHQGGVRHGRVGCPHLMLAAAAVVLSCSSCSSPPPKDDGLVGLLYHQNVKRMAEAQRMAPRQNGNGTSAPAVRNGNGASGTVAPKGNGTTTGVMGAAMVPAEGWPAYRISPGDVLSVSYFPRPPVEMTEYLIESGDVLTIGITVQETYRADVPVRPDGCISFYLIGELRVRGLTVAQVRAEIMDRLSRTMPGAEVTVILKEANSAAREFLAALRSHTDLGATRLMQVRHDGMVTFPLIGEIPAMGKTIRELSQAVEAAYDRYFRGGISVTVNLNSSSEGNIAVLGEVRNPGRYTIVNPVSPFFALAMAGGALPTAKKSEVVVVKRRPDGRVAWHVVNLDIDSGRPLGPEIPLSPQDMLLVPRTGIASLNLFVDQYIRRMLPGSIGYGEGNWQYWVTPR